jgi:hypothetical protein
MRVAVIQRQREYQFVLLDLRNPIQAGQFDGAEWCDLLAHLLDAEITERHQFLIAWCVFDATVYVYLGSERLHRIPIVTGYCQGQRALDVGQRVDRDGARTDRQVDTGRVDAELGHRVAQHCPVSRSVGSLNSP